MTWVKNQDELPGWEVVLIEREAEACYAERAQQEAREQS